MNIFIIVGPPVLESLLVSAFVRRSDERLIIRLNSVLFFCLSFYDNGPHERTLSTTQLNLRCLLFLRNFPFLFVTDQYLPPMSLDGLFQSKGGQRSRVTHSNRHFRPRWRHIRRGRSCASRLRSIQVVLWQRSRKEDQGWRKEEGEKTGGRRRWTE